MFDRAFSLILTVLAVALFHYSGTLDEMTSGGSIGPKEMPRFLAAGLFVAAVLNLISILKAKPAAAAQSAGEAGLEYGKFVKILAALVAYALMIERLGYVLSTFAFLFFSFQVMERGKYVKTGIIAAIFAGGVYGLYVKVAKGALPGFPFF
jgi:putative tricarboxylic transport membrane protein